MCVHILCVIQNNDIIIFTITFGGCSIKLAPSKAFLLRKVLTIPVNTTLRKS